MDTDRVDLVLQCVLAAAGAREAAARELTVTQLVKYAYLADVAHAARHAGATYTLAPWRFVHLGPHAPELEARVALVVRRTGATTRGAYYTLEDDERGLLRAAEQGLPAVVSSTIARAVRTFARDTYGLLAHVYATPPMRRASPGEALDFAPDAPAAPSALGAVCAVPPPARVAPAARAALRARLTAARAPAAGPVPAPRYGDACFDSGQRALDAAELPLVSCDGALTVAATVWTAAGRRERDVP